MVRITVAASIQKFTSALVEIKIINDSKGTIKCFDECTDARTHRENEKSEIFRKSRMAGQISSRAKSTQRFFSLS